jgi:hypothetical protein
LVFALGGGNGGGGAVVAFGSFWLPFAWFWWPLAGFFACAALCLFACGVGLSLNC